MAPRAIWQGTLTITDLAREVASHTAATTRSPAATTVDPIDALRRTDPKRKAG